MAEQQLTFEYNHAIEGIGLPPNLILTLGTEYGAIACIYFDEDTLIAARIEPIPYELHGSNRVFVGKNYQALIDKDEHSPCILNIVGITTKK